MMSQPIKSFCLPCVVKNTFLQFDDTEDDLLIPKRSSSAPPVMLRSKDVKAAQGRIPDELQLQEGKSTPPTSASRANSKESSMTGTAQSGDSVLDSHVGRVSDEQLQGGSGIVPQLTFTLPVGTVPQPCPDCEVLSLMIKNIPVSLTAEDVRKAIDFVGFQGQYNFFSMPLRHTNRGDANMGYAFVGFPHSSTSKAFAERMTGVCFAPTGKMAKCVTVLPAREQGSVNIMLPSDAVHQKTNIHTGDFSCDTNDALRSKEHAQGILSSAHGARSSRSCGVMPKLGDA